MSAEHVVINNSLQHLAAYDAELSDQAWLANQTGTVDLAESGELLFVSFGSSGSKCATGSEFCVRRYDSNGQTSWTTGLPATHPALLAPHPDGGAFAVAGFSGLGYEVFRIQPNGATELLVTIDEDETQYVSAAAADGAGGLIVAGATGMYGTGTAFVTRIRADGEVEWDQRGFFNGGVRSATLDVEVDGASVFVYGVANNSLEFLSFSGDAWGCLDRSPPSVRAGWRN